MAQARTRAFEFTTIESKEKLISDTDKSLTKAADTQMFLLEGFSSCLAAYPGGSNESEPNLVALCASDCATSRTKTRPKPMAAARTARMVDPDRRGGHVVTWSLLPRCAGAAGQIRWSRRLPPLCAMLDR